MKKVWELAADLLVVGIAGVFVSETLWQEEDVIVLLVFLCALIS